MKTTLFLFISFFVLATNTKAQPEELYHKISKEEFEVKFNPAYPTSELPNYFVDEIAKALPKIRMYTKIYYQYHLETKIVKKAAKYQVFLRVTDITRGGNFKYKGFDFSHLVAPEQIEQKLKIDDLSSNKTYYIKVRLGFYAQDSIWAPIKALNGVITFRVSAHPVGVKFIYGPHQKEKFQQAVKDIDTYYDDDLKLEAIKKRFLAINFDEVDVVALRNVDLKYIEKDLQKIQPQRYSESLNLQSYDPIRLLPRYDSLVNMVHQKRTIMNQRMGSLDAVYYRQGKEDLAAGDEKAALELFHNAIKANPYFSPAIYEIALVDFRNERYIDCFANLQHMLNDLKPDNATKKQSIKLAYQNYDTLIHICHKLNSEEKYNQSIDILYKVKMFCDSTQYIECDERLDQNISQAIYGLYSSYLSIAEASLQKGRLDMCREYMKMAKDFRAKNKDKLIGKDQESKRIMNELIRGLVNQSELANESGNLEKAKKLLNQAKVLCNENPGNDCKSIINKKQAIVIRKEYEELIQQSIQYSKQHRANKSKEYLSLAITYQQLHSDYIPTSIGTDTIEGKVRYIMYQENIANAKTDLKQGNYAYALTEFSEAKKLEDAYVFPRDEQLPTYLKSAAQPLIKETLKQGNLKAWGKHYKEAALLLDSARRMSKTYGLSDSVEVQKMTIELENQLKKNVCDKISADYLRWIKKANASEGFEDFYHAAYCWKEAINTAKKAPHCKLNTQQAKSKLQKYQYDIAYKTELHLADSLLEINPAACFSHLTAAEKIRSEKKDKIKSKHTQSLLDLILTYKNPELNIMGISYFNNNNQIENSYKLMVSALESNQEIERELINKTAHLLAIKDNEDLKPITEKANQRFGTKKELQAFKKAYIKASKK